MYENIAWENFITTGNIDSFLEYKKIKEIKEELKEKLEESEEKDI